MPITKNAASIRSIWAGSSTYGKVLFVAPIGVILFGLAGVIVQPGLRSAWLNVAVGLMLVMNQSIAKFLTPQQQKRAFIPQMVVLLTLGAYVIRTSYAHTRAGESTSGAGSLLIITFAILVSVPLLIALFRGRRKAATQKP